MDEPQPAERAPRQNTRHFIVAVLVLVPMFNFLMMAALSASAGEFLIGTFLAGVIGAQLAMHAIWIAMLAGKLWRRVLQSATVGLVWYSAWVLGMAVVAAQEGVSWRDFWFIATTYLLCCPLISLAAQSPFWLMRICFSWRIVHRDAPQAERPLAIRDIMSTTCAIAFVLASARYAPLAAFSTYAEALVSIAAVAVIVIVFSSAITLPLIFGTMKTKDGVLGCLITVSVLGAIIFLLLIVAGAVLRAPPDVITGFIAFFAALIVSQAGVLVTARDWGYVVATPRGLPPCDESKPVDGQH